MGSTLKIAQVVGSFAGNGGGVPRAVADHAKAMSTQGVTVTIFAGYSGKYPLSPRVFEVDPAQVVGGRLWGPPVLGLIPSVFMELSRRLEEFQLVHVNGVWNLTTSIVAALARRRNIPYVLSAHGHLGQYHFSRHRRLKPFLYRLLERRNIQGAAAIHLTSRWEVETSRGVLGSTRFVNIPWPIDYLEKDKPCVRAEARRLLNLPKDAFLVLCFGRIAGQKNPEFMLKAFAAARLPGQARLYFIGPSEHGIMESMKSLVSELGLEGRVVFVDYVAGAQKQYWLSACDLFALPSNDDNFCYAMIEAACSGVFSLVSPFVGAVEYLPDSHYKVQELNVDLWADALRKLHDYPPPQRYLSARDLGPLSFANVGARWLSLYEDIMKEKHDSR